MLNSINRFFPLIYSVLLGIASAYLLSGWIIFKLSGENMTLFSEKSVTQTNLPKIDTNIIFQENIFKVKIRPEVIQKENIPENKIVPDSEINEYNLIGFVKGVHPMALFKKKNRPVIIVDKNNPLEKNWFLKEIKNNTVYLINKKTKKIKLFKIKKEEQQRISDIIKIKNKSDSTLSSLRINKFRLKRKDINLAFRDINKFFKQIRIEPYFQGKKAIGYKLSYISPDCILRKIGLKKGDIITNINGRPTTRPNEVMSLFNQIKEMESVNLELLRNGKKETFLIEVE